MAYIGKDRQFGNAINFLKSAHFQAFTFTVEDTEGEMVNGRKIVKAGTVYKKDGKAVGILTNDVDVTHGAQEASVIVEGYILEKRLPKTVGEEDKQNMPEIKFY